MKIDKVLLFFGFFSYCLIGCFVDLVGCCVVYLLFDYKCLCWVVLCDWKW